ncbi:MAG: hypothetical protein ACR2IF_07560 [Terriglobales bacterium]
MRSRLCALVLLWAMSAVPAAAQGCVMCYTSAKGASDGGQHALTRAIFTLLIPPVGMMGVLVGFAFRYRKDDEEQQASAEVPEIKDSSDRT